MRGRQKRAKSKGLRAKSVEREALSPERYVPCSVLFRGTGILPVALIALLILCSAALTEVAGRDAGAPAVNTVVYDYSAKEATFDRKSGVTILKGDAKIRRSSGDYLNSDEITMYKDVETGELTKIEAVGNVDMKEKDMTATCERAVFYETEERIELEGSEDSPAVVDDGKNRMEAPAITYFRREDRLEASGNVSGHVTIEKKEGETGGQGDKETEGQGDKGTREQGER